MPSSSALHKEVEQCWWAAQAVVWMVHSKKKSTWGVAKEMQSTAGATTGFHWDKTGKSTWNHVPSQHGVCSLGNEKTPAIHGTPPHTAAFSQSRAHQTMAAPGLLVAQRLWQKAAEECRTPTARAALGRAEPRSDWGRKAVQQRKTEQKGMNMK